MGLRACFVGFVASLGLGCASTPRQPVGAPPTPTSITRADPGGDAADPMLAALQRLADEKWGFKRDKWNTLRVPLADATHWRRVRLWGYPMRASYRYGDEHYAVSTVYYQPSEGADDPSSCLEQFLRMALPVAHKFDVKVLTSQRSEAVQTVRGEERSMLVQVMDGSVDALLQSDDYVGAVAAYKSWPHTCLVHGFAVKATEHRDLAIKIRDRWVGEGAAKLLWEKKVKDAPPFDAR